MKLIKEFKDFAVKGNMIDMAIGIIIGASFNSVINVLVKNIILPPLSLISDGINFQEKKIILRDATEKTSQVSIVYRNYFRFHNCWLHHIHSRQIC